MPDSSAVADKTIYIRVPDDVHRELGRIAKAEDRRISYVAARILKTSLPNAKASTERKQ